VYLRQGRKNKESNTYCIPRRHRWSDWHLIWFGGVKHAIHIIFRLRIVISCVHQSHSGCRQICIILIWWAHHAQNTTYRAWLYKNRFPQEMEELNSVLRALAYPDSPIGEQTSPFPLPYSPLSFPSTSLRLPSFPSLFSEIGPLNTHS